MHLPTLLPSLLLAVSAFVAANPVANNGKSQEESHWDGQDGHCPRDGCLSDHSAKLIVSKFEQLFVKVTPEDAKKYLTRNFKSFSDSQNFATPNANYTPGAVTYSSRDDFVKGQQAAQSGGFSPPFTTLNIWHNCDTITFRWDLNFPPAFVKGIDVLVIERGTHLIKTDYSEFNNARLLTDFGCKITGCPGS